MLESVGKKLHEARLKRGLTIDEAAHATRLRPDKIVALENDDYSRFANNVYSKGFLQLYGRFLGVDVTEFASTLDSTNPIAVTDYQYLNSGYEAPKEERKSVDPRDKRQSPSVMPLVAFVVLLAAAGFGFQLFVKWQRVAGEPIPGSGRHPVLKAGTPSAAPSHDKPATDPVAPASAPSNLLKVPPSGVPSTAAAGALDRDFVAAQAPTAVSSITDEILVEPIRKTWIVVRKNDAKSPPVFEDYLYPDTPPLKLKGAKFFIEARDPSAIRIRKNGAPMAYQAMGVEIR